MKVLFLSLILMGVGFNVAVAQQPKKAKQKNNTSKPNAVEEIIRTNNADTLYLDLDNSIILTPKKEDNTKELLLIATQGNVSKLAPNFFQLSNLKVGDVVVTVIEKKSNRKMAEKKFVVAKQILPF
jgi:hypothetical protein